MLSSSRSKPAAVRGVIGAAPQGRLSERRRLDTRLRNFYRVECRDKNGSVKWVEEVENLVCTAGATDLLAKYFQGSAYTAAWYVGLYQGTGTLATSDTMASHAGWTETTGYSNANRPALTLGTPASGSVNNSGSVAVFNINATNTILGAFVCTNNTIGGTTGILYGEAAFSASRSVASGDTLNVTMTLTAS